MEKVEKHKIIVKQVVEEIASMIPDSEPIEKQTITDDIHGHYLLSAVGWLNNRHLAFHAPFRREMIPEFAVQ